MCAFCTLHKEAPGGDRTGAWNPAGMLLTKPCALVSQEEAPLCNMPARGSGDAFFHLYKGTLSVSSSPELR